MPLFKLEGIKEDIAYLKLWLGIMIVADISLVGWLFANFGSTHWFLLVSASLRSCSYWCRLFYNKQADRSGQRFVK
jgi:hypothetical protein